MSAALTGRSGHGRAARATASLIEPVALRILCQFARPLAVSIRDRSIAGRVELVYSISQLFW